MMEIDSTWGVITLAAENEEDKEILEKLVKVLNKNPKNLASSAGSFHLNEDQQIMLSLY